MNACFLGQSLPTLFDQILPPVEHGPHLHHEFYQLRSMDMFICLKRTKSIGISVQIRDMFSFVRLKYVLGAVCHGVM